MSGAAAFVTVERAGDIAVVTIDNPPVNALSTALRSALLSTFEELAADRRLAGLVLTSNGASFVAGADLREMERAPEEPHMPDVVAALDRLSVPVVAAIPGPALGGGLELALACDRRLAGPRASLGLTETRLGIVPGAGGTQRLPALVGIARAIDLVANGRILSADEALAIGLVDEIVETDLVVAAIAAAAAAPKRRLSALAPLGSDADAAAATTAALKRARTSPGVADAVELVALTASRRFAEGQAAERATFLRLRAAPESAAMRHVFFAEREAARVSGVSASEARDIRRVAVIGAGTMGSAIAAAVADAGIPVDLVERDTASLAAGEARLRAIYDGQVKAGRLAARSAAERLGRIALTTEFERTGLANLVIEAAFEDMAVKTEIVQRLDAIVRPGTLIATNTSYLDIDMIAAATGRPADVIGLHFFAPAHVMKLLEIVRGAATSPMALATALGFARRLKKVPVVAGVCDGFIGNRIFDLYRRHMEYLVEDGASPYQVDAALEAYGFALGPFGVFDLSGLDIAWAMRKRRAPTRPPAQRYVRIPDLLCEAGWLGRKAGRGWYRYENGRRLPDEEVLALIAREREARSVAPRAIAPEEICLRAVAVMANEGAKVLDEGIAQRASDIDVVFTNGFGFPRFRGGPMYAADRLGLAAVVTEVETAAREAGAGSDPSPLLVDLARRGASFASLG